MVIEHSFITTLEATDALRQASDYLTRLGFAVVPQAAFAMDGQPATISFTRGKKVASRAKRLNDLPQQVRIEWDRGRMTVAAAIEPYERTTFGTGMNLSPDSPKLAAYRQYLTALSAALEGKLSYQPSPDDVGVAEQRMAEAVEYHRRRRRDRIRNMLFLLAAVAVALVALAISLNS